MSVTFFCIPRLVVYSNPLQLFLHFVHLESHRADSPVPSIFPYI